MKKIFIVVAGLILSGCAVENPLTEFRFQTTMANPYVLASWHKINNVGAPIRIYIEGDGHSFDAHGRPTNNPTPKSTFLREISANDPNDNVAYLARPCQYLKTSNCTIYDWTTGRFSPEIINSMDEAITALMQKAGAQQAILIGYSGGAQVAGLVGVRNPTKIKKIITIAGVLDNAAWTAHFNDTPLNKSLNLKSYQDIFATIPQHHYIGSKDTVVPNQLTFDFVADDSTITVVKNATHASKFDKIIPDLYKEN